MDKLFKILAATLGGGIALGAGIRIGESLAGQEPETDKNWRRLEEAEYRLARARGAEHRTDPPAADVRRWMESEVDRRLSAFEADVLKQIDSVSGAMQSQVLPRVQRLEEAMDGQSADLKELRECSLQTERSMQKLLSGLERLIASQSERAPAAEPATEAPVAVPRRWGLST